MDSDDYYCLFAFGILDGLIFKKFKDIKKYYLSNVSDVLDKANMTAKVTKMVS